MLLDPVARFFTQRVFGPNRKILLADTLPTPASANPELQARRIAIQAEITELQRRQTNLMGELETLAPTGDPEVDAAWRAGIQTRFAANIAEQRTKTKLLTQISREQQDTTPPDPDLLDAVPHSDIDITLLPEDTQRRLYDTFHLEVRYNTPRREAILRITIDAETAPALAQAVNTALNIPAPRPSPETAKPAAGADAPAAGKAVCDVLSAPGRIRTCARGVRQGVDVGTAHSEVMALLTAACVAAERSQWDTRPLPARLLSSPTVYAPRPDLLSLALLEAAVGVLSQGMHRQ